jgi:glycosyltransferase involved in cell wall biosynthesis
MTADRPQLVVVGPTPPPVHGVTASTRLVLENRLLKNTFEIIHVETSDHRPRTTMERWDASNVIVGLRSALNVARATGPANTVVYLPISENFAAFLRDALVIWVAKTRRARVAAHIRNSTFDRFVLSRRAPGKMIIKATMRRADSVAVLGRAIVPLLEGIVDPAAIAVVPNGTPDVGRILPAPGPPTVVFLSNLLRRKGVVEALEACKLALDEVSDAVGVFAGEWESAELEDDVRARSAHYADRIEFPGPVYNEAKERLFARATVLLFPPVSGEGHPRILLEALCRGIPVVTTDRATIRETIDDGRSGFVLPDPEPSALADRLIALLTDTERRRRMADAARSAYEDRFTQDVADRRISDWLHGVWSAAR